MSEPGIVVVGASMGGMRAAEAARRAGYLGSISVVGAENYLPYNRPPLSKEAFAGGAEAQPLIFRIPKAATDIDWVLGTEVVSADLNAQTITDHTGLVRRWEGLIIATGLRPRRLTIPGPSQGRYVIRTIDDVRLLRSRLTPADRLVIIGAGFIGCELAATCRKLGIAVTIVAPEPVPMFRPLGIELGAALQRHHERHGVQFKLGFVPTSYHGTHQVTGIELNDGSPIPADIVVEAVGCAPNTEWLTGNGLDLSDGVECDNYLRLINRPQIAACGDIAKFPNLLFDEVPRRVEHWTMVTDTARRAGTSLARWLRQEPDLAEPFAPVPSFWSDQYDMRIQSFGAVGLGGDDIRILEGNLDGEVVVGYFADDRLIGVVMIGFGGRHSYYRQLIADYRPPPR